ncbi:Gfo/Idh/MocA family oxidoreductase [Streptomyces sp. NPDC059118]|uniref:Gfo/Idh/MocA family oxidoreductase n=1 Tax=unclassified Streptomyces TaxID=2593676 RepID=UPI003691061F
MPAFRGAALMTGGTQGIVAPLRIGVLGAAATAPHRMPPAFVAVPETCVTAVAARTPGHADSLAAEYGCAAVTPYDVLLDRIDVDAPYIPRLFSPYAHRVRRALLAGKHMVVEKPLTGGPGEAAEPAEPAAARSLVLTDDVTFVPPRRPSPDRRTAGRVCDRRAPVRERHVSV